MFRSFRDTPLLRQIFADTTPIFSPFYFPQPLLVEGQFRRQIIYHSAKTEVLRGLRFLY